VALRNASHACHEIQHINGLLSVWMYMLLCVECDRWRLDRSTMSVAESDEVTVLASEPERKDLQSVVSIRGKLKPEQAIAALQKRKQGSVWKDLVPILVDDDSKLPSKKVAKLQCTECNALLCAGNPGNVSSDHFDSLGNCKKQLERKRQGSLLTGSNSSKRIQTASSSQAANKQPSIQNFVVRPAQAAAAIEEIFKGLLCVALPYAPEQPNINKAFSMMGVQLPGNPSLLGA
jgi:hypothetical protein